MPDDVQVKSMPPEMSQSVAKLRQKFVDQLEQRILALEASLVDFVKSQAKTKPANAICFQCHNISGLASSLGFDEIGAAAAAADCAWGRAIKVNLSPAALTPALETVEKLLELLEDALEP